MKPLHTYTGHQTFDLTEAKVHVLPNDDGTRRLVALLPKETSKGPRVEMRAIKGDMVNMSPHLVTEWEEIIIIPVLPPAG